MGWITISGHDISYALTALERYLNVMSPPAR